jgi:Ni,Fe-hydrogenase III large subunit
METLTGNANYLAIKNQSTVNVRDIPAIPYELFSSEVIALLQQDQNHCVSYYAFPYDDQLKFICCIANDLLGNILLLSHEQPLRKGVQLISITKSIYALHIYEREIAENHGVEFIHSPWDKPVRYAFDRADRKKIINDYPFYKIQSDELHEVGVGPIHAGVIEPGHFRFLCNGETVLHLEIQLGWQHRGVEKTYLTKTSVLQRTILSESIAADTAVGHATAFAGLMESLGCISINDRLYLERTIGLELERVAMHIGDLSNMCIGLAYQLGSSVFGALRTPTINFSQLWCGNRFGKGLIRVGGTHYPMNDELIDSLLKFLNNFEERFQTMANKMFALPSVLMRMENIGTVTRTQMQLIGAVGMAARMTGIARDVRCSHPGASYLFVPYDPVTEVTTGDVWARALLRKLEIEKSIEYIRALVRRLQSATGNSSNPAHERDVKLTPHSLAVSLTEGWRGEICHSAVTNKKGEIIHYKVKDPSVHNWMALALSLRDLEISDFPINNKSYNLSYCGHDL